MLSVPAHLGPDETEYMRLVAFISEHDRFPEFGADAGFGVELRSVGGTPYPYRSYADRPGLPFVLSALMVKLPTDSEWMDFSQARIPGAVYAALLVILGFLAARAMFPTRRNVACLVAISLAFWPQVTAMMSVVNDDGFTAMVCAGLFWSWYRGIELGWSRNALVTAGVFTGLALLGKPSAFLLVPATVMAIVLTHPEGRRATGRALTIVGAVALLVCGWRYVIAYNMYGVDIFNRERTQVLSDAVGGTTHPARDYATLIQLLTNMPIVTPLGNGSMWSRTATTFVTSISYHGLRLSAPWMAGFLFFASMAVWAHLSRPPGFSALWRSIRGRLHIVVMLTVLAYVVGIVWRVYTIDAVMVGQYLFPALVPILGAIAWGLDDLAGRGGLPARLILVAYPVFLMSANLWSLKLVTQQLGQPLMSWVGSWQFILVLGWSAVTAATAITILSHVRYGLWPIPSAHALPR
jgi:4-amino-4-deoxy-L-arabinose transferase-like glycosyltransferase